jgi:imidazolonepropionase-like amidohydrolase
VPIRTCLASVAAAIILVTVAPVHSRAQELAITNVTVIDGTGHAPRANQTVLVDRGRITAVGPSARTTPAGSTRIVDGRGRFLIPGLCDAHAHLYHGARRLAQLLAHGVTCIHEMWGETPRIATLRREIDSGQRLGPSILTVAGGWPDSGDAPRARSVVDSLVRLGADFIKVGSLHSPAWYGAMLDAARERRVRVIGHLPTAVPAPVVVRGGQSRLEHVAVELLIATSANADSLLARWIDASRTRNRDVMLAIQRAAVATQSDARRASLFREMVEQRVALTPTLLNHRASAMLADSAFARDPRLASFDDTTRQAWSAWLRRQPRTAEHSRAAKELYQAQLALVRDMHRAGVMILAGSDVGDHYRYYGPSLHDEMVLLAAAGLAPMAVLQAATRNPAAHLGLLSERGTVEVGRRADLVLLAGDPLADLGNVRRVEAVVYGGRLLMGEELSRARRGAAP